MTKEWAANIVDTIIGYNFDQSGIGEIDAATAGDLSGNNGEIVH
jgi:hypothetical protein